MKKVYDKEGREIPHHNQLGISDQEFEERMMGDPDQFDRWYNPKVLGWQLKREADKRAFLVRKAEKEKIENATHWYNSLSAEKKTELISRIIPKASDIVALFLQKLPMSNPMYQYYIGLSNRVYRENLDLKGIPYSKLKKFPKYDLVEDQLTGAPDHFVSMMMIVFPPKGKRGRTKLVF